MTLTAIKAFFMTKAGMATAAAVIVAVPSVAYVATQNNDKENNTTENSNITPTPTAEPTVVPTSTPEPTMTPTPEPTATPLPTLAATSTPKPTATKAPAVTKAPTATPKPTTPPSTMKTYSNGVYSYIYDTSKFTESNGQLTHTATGKKLTFGGAQGGMMGNEMACNAYVFTLGNKKIYRTSNRYEAIIEQEGKCYQGGTVLYVCTPGGITGEGYLITISVEGGNTGEFDSVVKTLKALKC